jgi:hypothetical protein
VVGWIPKHHRAVDLALVAGDFNMSLWYVVPFMRPIFIITVRGKHWAIVGGVEAINHHVIRHVKMKSGGG